MSTTRRTSNTPSTVSDRRRGVPRSSSSSLKTKLATTSSSGSISNFSSRTRPSSSLWLAVASKAQNLLFKGSSKYTYKRHSSTPRIKAATTLAPVFESLTEAHEENDASVPAPKEPDITQKSQAVLAVDYNAPLGTYHMPRAIGVIVKPMKGNQRVFSSSRAKNPAGEHDSRRELMSGKVSRSSRNDNRPPKVSFQPPPPSPRVITSAELSASRFPPSVTNGTKNSRDKRPSRARGSPTSQYSPGSKSNTKGAVNAPLPKRIAVIATSIAEGASQEKKTVKTAPSKGRSLNKDESTRTLAKRQKEKAPATPTRNSSKTSQSSEMSDAGTTKPLPNLPPTPLQFRISVKPPSFIPLQLSSSASDIPSVPKLIRGKENVLRLPSEGSRRRASPTSKLADQSRVLPARSTGINVTRKSELPNSSRRPLASIGSNAPNPVKKPMSPIRRRPQSVRKPKATLGPSRTASPSTMIMKRRGVPATVVKSRSPRDISTINAFIAPSRTRKGETDVSTVNAEINIVSSIGNPPGVSSSDFSNSSLYPNSATQYPFLTSSHPPITVRIISSTSLDFGNHPELEDQSILAEKPLSELYSHASDLSMLPLLARFPEPPQTPTQAQETDSVVEETNSIKDMNRFLVPISPSLSKDPHSRDDYEEHGRVTSDRDVMSSGSWASGRAWDSDQLDAQMKLLEEDVWSMVVPPGADSKATSALENDGKIKMAASDSLFDLGGRWCEAPGDVTENLLEISLDDESGDAPYYDSSFESDFASE